MSDPAPVSDRFLPGRHAITGYGKGGFGFAGMTHRGSLLAIPSGMRAWDVVHWGQLSDTSFADIVVEADAIDFLVIGCGQTPAALPAHLAAFLRSHAIRCDIMPTAAAARTYNVLLAEDRRVAAALIAVE